MKKIFASAIAVLIAGVSYSQIQWAIKGGLNLATARYINDNNAKVRIGYYTGALVEIPFQNLFVRPEVLYSSKGFAFLANEYSRAGSVRLNYITFPLLLGFTPISNAAIMAGPEIGFLQKAVSRSNGFSTDMTHFYRRFEVAFDLGVAYSLNRSFGIEARYSHGFKNLVNVLITDNSGSVTGQGRTGANRVLLLGVYLFL